jgi:hypothetical protein
MYCRLFKPIILFFNSLEHKKVYYLFYIVYSGVYRFNYDRSSFVWVYSIRSGAAKWLWWWMMSRGAWVLWAPPNLALFGYRFRGPSASIYFTTRQSICTRIWCAAAYISHRFLILWWCSKKCVDVLPVVFVHVLQEWWRFLVPEQKGKALSFLSSDTSETNILPRAVIWIASLSKVTGRKRVISTRNFWQKSCSARDFS